MRHSLNLKGGLRLAVLLGAIACGAAGGPTCVAQSGQPEVYFAPDVVAQFNQLALRPEALAFGLGDSPDPDIHKHYQGIVRRHGPGTPYLFVSRSGNDVPECVTDCAPEPGNLVVVRMGSRDAHGERLRSNRLARDWPIALFFPTGEPNLWPTPPDPRDAAVAVIYFDGRNGWPSYGHPGGMQLVGDVLAVPLTTPYPDIPFPFPSPAPAPPPDKPANLILFLDVSSPETPVLTSRFAPAPSDEFQAGQVALTPVLNPLGPGLRYLMLVAGKDNKEVRLYRSLSTPIRRENGEIVLDADGPTNLKASNLGWRLLRSWSGEELDDPGVDTWPCCGSQAHQMFNFVRQGSLDGPLFLIGARNTHAVQLPGGGEDVLDLYQVHVDRYGNPGDDLLTRVERKHVATDTIGGGGDASHFAGSSGVYVSPSGELIVYASQHNNEGPHELLPNGGRGRRTVRFGEWRHREMVRPGSPTLRPTVEALGPFDVDEGGAVTLSARGKGPVTKAWLQLFEDDGLGLSDDFDGDEWLVADYEDWLEDDFDDFTKLLWFFNDNAGSWRWFAPVGCTLRVNEHSFGGAEFPGARKTLFGTGRVEEEPDLDAVPDDSGAGSMDDRISSVQFFPTGGDNFADCRAYYNAPIEVAWDFDLDGVFEHTGQNPTFSAAELDGPGVRSVPAAGLHPTDPTPLGLGAPVEVNIRVHNVAPRVASFDLVDSLGLKVGSDVTFALVNLEYAARGSFTDPGRPDHQTAALSLGEGVTIPSSAFDAFSDAFGGATGQLRHRHTYGATGTYTLRLEVVDDDGGLTAASRSVNVVSPAEALRFVVGRINLLLAGATNPKVITALRDARHNLAGNPNGSPRNGALQELANGDRVAALVKIGAAIKALESAEASGGGDLGGLKYLLGLTGESVAQGTYLEAVAGVGPPSPGEAAQLERVRQTIAEGHALLAGGRYVGAVERFKDAVARAVSLL